MPGAALRGIQWARRHWSCPCHGRSALVADLVPYKPEGVVFEEEVVMNGPQNEAGTFPVSTESSWSEPRRVQADATSGGDLPLAVQELPCRGVE